MDVQQLQTPKTAAFSFSYSLAKGALKHQDASDQEMRRDNEATANGSDESAIAADCSATAGSNGTNTSQVYLN